MCDSDEYCKGFVQIRDGCEIATISKCPHGCDKRNEGCVGSLTTKEYMDKYYYQGCWIKYSGNFGTGYSQGWI